MVFFSNILKSSIKNSSNKTVAKLADFVVKIDNQKKFPVVVGIITSKNQFIPLEEIKSWEPKITLINSLNQEPQSIPAGNNFAKLNEIMDKQIVDLAGQRLVRVNDLQLGLVQGEMCVVAVDISTRGLLRRLGFAGKFFDLIFKANFLEWKDMKLVDNKLHLPTGVSELVKLHPADIANIIEKLNIHQGSSLLQSLDQQTAARVLEEIQPDIQKMLVKHLGTERTAKIMDKMSVDELVDLMQILPGKESQAIIGKLPVGNKVQKIKKIMEYDEDTAGGLMTTECLTVLPTVSVKEVLEEIRISSKYHHSIQFVYVINSQGQFLGLTSLRNLIIAKENQTIGEIMKKRNALPIATVDQSLAEVSVMMTKYNLLSVVVLDEENNLLGVVTADDIMRRLIPEA